MQTLLEREYTEAYRDETGVPRYRMELARLKKPEKCAPCVLRES